MTLTDWSCVTGICISTLASRLRRGMDVDAALEEKPISRRECGLRSRAARLKSD